MSKKFAFIFAQNRPKMMKKKEKGKIYYDNFLQIYFLIVNLQEILGIMIERTLKPKLLEMSLKYPIVTLTGPRQS